MSFPKKKSRKIIVEDNPYYWICSRGGEYHNFHSNISIIAANIKNSKKLFAYISYALFDSDGFSGDFTITPYIIKQVIALGIQQGYDPLNADNDLNLGEVSDAIILNQETKLTILLNRVTNTYQETKFDKEYSTFKNNDQYVDDVTSQLGVYIKSKEWILGFKLLMKLIDDLNLTESVELNNFIERIRKEEKYDA